MKIDNELKSQLERAAENDARRNERLYYAGVTVGLRIAMERMEHSASLTSAIKNDLIQQIDTTARDYKEAIERYHGRTPRDPKLL